jgi:hypothetical protein
VRAAGPLRLVVRRYISSPQWNALRYPIRGAEDNVIPRYFVEKIEESGLFLPTRTLKTPVRVDLDFQVPGLTSEVHHQAQLTVELHLAAGPLRLRNCKWLIVQHDMDEVLIGRPFFRALGLDGAEHLSAVRDEYNNMDCSQIPSLTCAGKLTRLLLRDLEIEPKSLPAPQVLAKSAQLDSVTYGELDAGPVEVPQLLDLPASVSSDKISTELESMVRTAQKNGMPSQDVPTLRHLVNEFTDIWSTSLQSGPPATLPPLVIRLKPDAVPVSVRLRRYSQEQHDFLALFVKPSKRPVWCTEIQVRLGARPRALFQSPGRTNSVSR